MRQLSIIVLMVITIGAGIAGFVNASKPGGSAAFCGLAVVTGLLFLILAARNGRKQTS